MDLNEENGQGHGGHVVATVAVHGACHAPRNEPGNGKQQLLSAAAMEDEAAGGVSSGALTRSPRLVTARSRTMPSLAQMYAAAAASGSGTSLTRSVDTGMQGEPSTQGAAPPPIPATGSGRRGWRTSVEPLSMAAQLEAAHAGGSGQVAGRVGMSRKPTALDTLLGPLTKVLRDVPQRSKVGSHVSGGGAGDATADPAQLTPAQRYARYHVALQQGAPPAAPRPQPMSDPYVATAAAALHREQPAARGLTPTGASPSGDLRPRMSLPATRAQQPATTSQPQLQLPSLSAALGYASAAAAEGADPGSGRLRRLTSAGVGVSAEGPGSSGSTASVSRGGHAPITTAPSPPREPPASQRPGSGRLQAALLRTKPKAAQVDGSPAWAQPPPAGGALPVRTQHSWTRDLRATVEALAAVHSTRSGTTAKPLSCEQAANAPFSFHAPPRRSITQAGLSPAVRAPASSALSSPGSSGTGAEHAGGPPTLDTSHHRQGGVLGPGLTMDAHSAPLARLHEQLLVNASMSSRSPTHSGAPGTMRGGQEALAAACASGQGHSRDQLLEDGLDCLMLGSSSGSDDGLLITLGGGCE